MKRILILASLLVVFAARPSSATLINPTVVMDTPELWQGSVDWSVTVQSGNVTLDIGPSWLVTVNEIPLSGSTGLLLVTAVHLVAPHTPPAPSGLGLSLTFGPLAPGATSLPSTDQEPHADDPGHFDLLTASLQSVNATTSRLNITLQHMGDVSSVPMPEPSSLVLLASGLVAMRRRRRSVRRSDRLR